MFVYNEFWEYQRTIAPPSSEYPYYNGPTYSININGVIFVTANGVLNKYDKYLNLTKQRAYTYGVMRGIYYNPLDQLIYVANQNNRIYTFDQNLKIISYSNFSFSPWFITGYNGQIVVGDYSNGKVYFYQGNSITRTIQTQCSGRISSILFDDNGNMLVLCEVNDIDYVNLIYIYNSNGAFTEISKSTCIQPIFINFDSKNRLVITCRYQIDIYY